MTTIAARTTTSTGSLARTVAVATLVAAVAVEALVALVNAAGPNVVLQGKAMPAGGCAVGVLMCMVPAIALIAALRRWSADPARTWLRATVGLTALSLVPDLVVSGTPTGSRFALMGAHLLAAAIVIPAVARALSRVR